MRMTFRERPPSAVPSFSNTLLSGQISCRALRGEGEEGRGERREGEGREGRGEREGEKKVMIGDRDGGIG